MCHDGAETKATPFTIDGHALRAKPGETMLSVAKRHGIEIPALCYRDAVSPYGACRLCTVEVFWGKRSKLVASCIYIPSEGDVIETNNERVRQMRRMILELLLAKCPDVELIRSLALEYGVREPRFPTKAGERTDRCILCGLCVRVCAEVIGQHAIGYEGRGTGRAIVTPFRDQTEDCIGCGACVFVCPTGALHYEDVDGRRIMKELNTVVPLLECRVCGRPFATAKQIQKIRERLNLSDEIAETCPACRGATFRELMAQILVDVQPAGVNLGA